MVALFDQAELIRRHHRLQYLSFLKLAMASKGGLLPSKLDQVKQPSCAHCVYGSTMQGDRREGSKPSIHATKVNLPNAQDNAS
eukprot:2605217-Ditylum_brightwellii.AAC.1